MRHIAVMGSLNMDFVTLVERLPAAGETVLGRGFRMIPGGKGANQACAAAKLGKAGGPPVRMAGRVGRDVFGENLKASLRAAGVDVSAVETDEAEATGVALIAVERSGQNQIVVASGANHGMTAAGAEKLRSVFRGAAFVLFQLETPLQAVEAGLRAARAEGARTMLDPAPARELPDELLAWVDFLTPNETEARALLGLPAGRVGQAEAREMAAALRARGAGSVVVKLGEQGCLLSDASGDVMSPAFAAEAVDTTAAGDTFNAALAVALTEGLGMAEALRFANAAAGLSTRRAGAQASIPERAEVDLFLAGRGPEAG